MHGRAMCTGSLDECVSLLVESLRMRRSWPRYIFVTLQGTGLILPCLALLLPRLVSVCVCMF